MLATTILCLDCQSRRWNQRQSACACHSLQRGRPLMLSRSMEDEKPAATAGNEKIPATVTPTPTPKPASLGAVASASPASTVPNEDQASVNPAPGRVGVATPQTPEAVKATAASASGAVLASASCHTKAALKQARIIPFRTPGSAFGISLCSGTSDSPITISSRER